MKNKTYRFRITLYPATFGDGFRTVVFGSETYANGIVEATFKDALTRRQQISDAEPRGHAAFLGMANRNDRNPPGMSTKGQAIYGGHGAKP